MPDPDDPDQPVPPPPFHINPGNRHQMLPFYTDKATGTSAAAVAAHKAELTWVRAFYTLVVRCRATSGSRAGAWGLEARA